MSNFAPNLSRGPCLYCEGMAESGPEELLRCELCRNTVHVCCVKSGIPVGRLLGDNFFLFTCSDCQPGGQDSTVRAQLNTPQLLLLVLYNLHMTQANTARSGFFHWKVHIYQFINQHWKEIFGPESHKKKKKTLQASLSGQLSHYGQYFVSGYETLHDGGWYKLSMVLPPAQLIQMYTAEKSRGLTAKQIKEDISEITVKEEPFPESSSQDDSSQGSWFMEKDILRPHNLPPLSLFDSEEETEESCPEIVSVKKEGEYKSFQEDTDMEFIDIGAEEVHVSGSQESEPTFTKTSLFTKNPVLESKEEDSNSDVKWTRGENIRPLSGYEEKKLVRELKRLQEAGPLPAKLHRLLRKLIVRKSKHEHGVPQFDLDAETRFYKAHGRLQTRPERLKSRIPQEPDDSVRVLDRFQISAKEDCSLEEKNVSFLTKLIGSGDEPPSLIHSPYTLRDLKPYIMRDYESEPLKLRLLQEIIKYPNRNDENWSPPPRYPVDYCYVTPKHIPAMNQMARHFFWPGIDLSEVLQYPDHTCVVLYRQLVIGFGILVPDTNFNTAYLSFLLVHPEWQRAGIATFVLYHLIQTCMGKDITLHVSAANPALILYQKFGFKVEEFLLDFYDKYLPEDSNDCKHAMFLRLSR
ncbi:cysteine-rich protein 2-binding protein [Macrobrachium rosenbergii]|uniref:cysteine-rich protein 2-binding protein n=1 Tax=Macrobrachium rosenbergii TaxID=79674 RepID=UPI0034D50CEA